MEKHYREVKCSDRLPKYTKHNYPGLYEKWKSIKSRCYQKKSVSYSLYGDRGIIMYSGWVNNPHTFISYCLTLDGWDDKTLTIDRINPLGNYEPDNLRFATRTIQSRNQRKRIGNNKYTGVTCVKNKYRAAITVNYKFIHIGYFNTEEDAMKARNRYIVVTNLKGFNLQTNGEDK